MNSPQPDVALELRPDHPEPARPSPQALRRQAWVSSAIIVVGVAIGLGAIDIPSEAGYGGVGANFLPWVVGITLVLCGALLLREARTGGFRSMEAPAGAERPDWPAFAWVSAGLLLNWVLIENLGFILSCALTYTLAAQGLRRAYGKPRDTWLLDLVSGVVIAAPVYWLFTKFLAINLPGLTGSGWI